ncbi:MAG TPA: cytochrome c [Candidatus Binataceae bacterium]|nr:cytochrome c [Candidatus Binataceae bacterium]
MATGFRFSKLALASAVGSVLICGLAPWTRAQEMGPGGRIITGIGQYRTHCAQCHGMDGKGDGPMAAVLNVKPADLTTLAKDNGGVFPEERVLNSINGTEQVAAHGTKGEPGASPMPVWGLAFRASSGSGSGADFTPQEIQKKIKLIVDYIKTIQVK